MHAASKQCYVCLYIETHIDSWQCCGWRWWWMIMVRRWSCCCTGDQVVSGIIVSCIIHFHFHFTCAAACEWALDSGISYTLTFMSATNEEAVQSKWIDVTFHIMPLLDHGGSWTRFATIRVCRARRKSIQKEDIESGKPKIIVACRHLLSAVKNLRCWFTQECSWPQ